jgi:hypothetical protein
MRRLTWMVYLGVMAMTVVVDDHGRQVTDLKPSDIEIVERGVTPKIHHAVYVPVGGGLSLGDTLSRGSYTLQVSVAPGGARRAQATQWVEFEVR